MDKDPVLARRPTAITLIKTVDFSCIGGTMLQCLSTQHIYRNHPVQRHSRLSLLGIVCGCLLSLSHAHAFLLNSQTNAATGNAANSVKQSPLASKHYDSKGRYLGKSTADGKQYDAKGRYLGKTTAKGKHYDAKGRYLGKSLPASSPNPPLTKSIQPKKPSNNNGKKKDDPLYPN